MKAVVLEKPLHFRSAEISEPGRPGAGEALVRVHRVGICGTDISGYLGKMPFFQYPLIPGHELGVEVIETGPGVTNVRAGDCCAVEPYMNCRTCHACRKGASNCCVSLKVIGVMCNGGLCERFLVRADKVHPAGAVTFDQLALVETLAIGCHACDRGQPLPGENALIIGAGPIGLATLAFVRLTGARTIVMDLNQKRLTFSKESMGADEVLLIPDIPVSPDEIVQDLRELTGGNLPDVVFDATGSATSMSAAFGYVAPTGRLIFVGITTGEVTFRHPLFHKPEGTLLCSRNALPRDFTRIIGLIGQRRLDTTRWITHRTDLDGLAGAFPSYLEPEAGVIKAVVEVP